MINQRIRVEKKATGGLSSIRENTRGPYLNVDLNCLDLHINDYEYIIK